MSDVIFPTEWHKEPEETQTDQFFRLLETISKQRLETARAKNTDYAGNGDPFANFRACEQIGVSTPRGMLVRMQDKMQRISNLLTRPPAVASEPLSETLLDLANYADILHVWLLMHPKGTDE